MLDTSLLYKSDFIFRYVQLPLELGPRNGMVEWVGMKCLAMLAALKTVCFPFVGLNHKIVK